MKNLIFKIKWLLKFRMQFRTGCEKCIAIITEKFTDDRVGHKVLDLYRFYRDKGYKTYVVCAFNNAPMGKYLEDLRHIYIFNNSPEIFVEYCHKKGINVLHYVEKDMMLGAVSTFGFRTLYSVCGSLVAETAPRLAGINYVIFDSAENLQSYIDMTGQSNGMVADKNTDFSTLI